MRKKTLQKKHQSQNVEPLPKAKNNMHKITKTPLAKKKTLCEKNANKKTREKTKEETLKKKKTLQNKKTDQNP